MEVKGVIKKILPTESGTTKDGKEWKKQLFVLSNNDGYEGKEAIYCFEIFGEEKVDTFNKYNKEGSVVDVNYRISTNEWNGKYFTSLQAWKIFKAETQTESAPEAPTQQDEDNDNLPF